MVLVSVRSIESITLVEILAAARGQGDGVAPLAFVQEVVDRLRTAVADSLEGETLRDLVLADGASPAEAENPDAHR